MADVFTRIGQRPGLNRAWGDGGGDERLHVIMDIDLHSPLAEQYVACRCDTLVTTDGFTSLDQAWSSHRGLVYVQPALGDLATDAEVSDFLRQLDEPGWVPAYGRADGRVAVAAASPDLTHAFELMARLQEEREAVL